MSSIEGWEVELVRPSDEYTDNEEVETVDRLSQVQRRRVYPVFTDRLEPALVTIHGTKSGAEAKVEHLRGPDCDDEYCFHTNDAFVGSSVEILP